MNDGVEESLHLHSPPTEITKSFCSLLSTHCYPVTELYCKMLFTAVSASESAVSASFCPNIASANERRIASLMSVRTWLSKLRSTELAWMQRARPSKLSSSEQKKGS